VHNCFENYTALRVSVITNFVIPKRHIKNN